MLVIGVDIGGTSIKGAAVRPTGEVVDTFGFPVVKNDPYENTIGTLVEEIKKFIAKLKDPREVVGIGVGIPGLIDVNHGVVNYSCNLNWTEVPIQAILEKEIGLPVRITNDANAATLGEAKFGAGKLYKNLIMLTLGTGIGGGIIIDGKLFEGNEGKGAEMGHMTLVMDGEPCGCGRCGCFEQYASATALVRQTKKAMEENKNSLMWELAEGDINKVNGRIPFEAEKQGDATAHKVVDQYVKYLAEGILNYCNVLRPEAVILSGGIANQGSYLNNKLTEYCINKKYGYAGAPATAIITAVLGYQSGMVGAAALFY